MKCRPQCLWERTQWPLALHLLTTMLQQSVDREEVTYNSAFIAVERTPVAVDPTFAHYGHTAEIGGNLYELQRSYWCLREGISHRQPCIC